MNVELRKASSVNPVSSRVSASSLHKLATRSLSIVDTEILNHEGTALHARQVDLALLGVGLLAVQDGGVADHIDQLGPHAVG